MTWKELPNGDVFVKGMIAEWYETADAPLLTGLSLWDENWRYNIHHPELTFWGKVEIFVEGGEGVWKGTWHGDGVFLGDPPYALGLSHIEGGITLTITGHGGDIQGMVAKATYSINTEILYKWAFIGKYH